MVTSSIALPDTDTIKVNVQNTVLFLSLNRPQVRNAMSLKMVAELEAVFSLIENEHSIRTVIIRGEGGLFCAGGDVNDMAQARHASYSDQYDPIYKMNRAFGQMMQKINAAPQVVITLCEGPVLGGGMGLVCASDITLSDANAHFGLPETSLGILPAQIIPFVVQRIGHSQARRLALTGMRLNGKEAQSIGLVHEVFEDKNMLETYMEKTLDEIARCAPLALANTKSIIRAIGTMPLEQLLDRAAMDFAQSVRSPEGTEGTMAFLEKRKPFWNDRQVQE